MSNPSHEDLTDAVEADSPFLPGTNLQYAWDSVSLTAAMSCWRRYYYQTIEGRTSKSPSRAIALQFGIAFHKGMEFYHQHRASGLTYDDAVASTIQDLTLDPHYASLPTLEEVQAETDAAPEDDDGITARNSKVRTRYHLMRAVVWYLDHYREDPIQTLILPSGRAAVEVSFRIELPCTVAGQPALLSGHLDRVGTFNDYLYVVDYKTTKSISRQFFSDFQLSHQFSGYTIGGNAIFDRPLRGAIIDGIALLVGGAKFSRGTCDRTESQLDEYIETVQNTLDEAERHASTGLYPMNTSACYFCEFKEICSTPREYRNAKLNMLFHAGKGWNPLANR